MTNENARAVAELCAHLDGLPLAIELAAARLRLFPPQALLSRLASRLRLLSGGARDLPERQRTLYGAIDWSYSLLSPEEQILFGRLSAFAGRCTVEAAEAVCGAGDPPLDVLGGIAALIDNSLLRREGDKEPRLTMLETIRLYAQEKLAAGGEGEDVRRRHARYYVEVTEAVESLFYGAGSEQERWVARRARPRQLPGGPRLGNRSPRCRHRASTGDRAVRLLALERLLDRRARVAGTGACPARSTGAHAGTRESAAGARHARSADG